MRKFAKLVTKEQLGSFLVANRKGVILIGKVNRGATNFLSI